jgi:hypothetical protein
VLMLEQKLRQGFSQRLFLTEVVLYIGVGILLSISAAVGILETTAFLWQGIITRTLTNYGFLMLDRLLLVLMLVEILQTVRISIHSKEFMLLVEPFLIVGLIATIHRVLVIAIVEFVGGIAVLRGLYAELATTLFGFQMMVGTFWKLKIKKGIC